MTTHVHGQPIYDKNNLKDSKTSAYFMTHFMPDVTYITFKFKEPMLVSHYEIIYAAIHEDYINDGATDP